MADAKKAHQKAFNFWEKFADVQSKVSVRRDKPGAHGAKYRDLNSILDVVKPALATHKLFLLFHEEFGDEGIVKCTAKVSDGEQTVEAFGHAAIDPSQRGALGQKYGAATTYARRYAVEGLFCICETACFDDIDATVDAAAKKPAAWKKPPVKKPAAKKPATKKVATDKRQGPSGLLPDPAPTEKQLKDAKGAYRKLASDYGIEFSQVLLFLKEELNIENWSDIKTYGDLQAYYLQVRSYCESNGEQVEDES